MVDDDGYGRAWSYRVFSVLNTEPDTPHTGHRFLTVHVVHWVERPPPDYPVPGDVFAIDAQPATPSGELLEDAILDVERIRDAFDKPALIMAEWSRFITKPVNAGMRGSAG